MSISAGLHQRQAQALGAQGELQARAVAAAVHALAPAGAAPLGLQQAHVLVKAHGARREVELARQIADGVGGGHGRACCRAGAGQEMRRVLK
jgi:hypothetical protein